MTTARPERPKRVYKAVEAAADADGFVVRLDGRPARTPAGGALRAPTLALARTLAQEWEAQVERVDFDHMPLTRLAFTALDRTLAAREGVIEEILRYAGNDLLAYRAEGPARLIARQEAAFAPVLDWAAATLGLSLPVVRGLAPAPPPQEEMDRLADRLKTDGAFELTGLAYGSALFGSAVLALALADGRVSGEEAFQASRVEESWQTEMWGEDAEAERRALGLRLEAMRLETWFQALRPTP